MPLFRQHSHSLWSMRLALLLSIAIVVPLGYWVRFTGASEWAWLHDALGSVAYEAFWILLILLVWPQGSPEGGAAIARIAFAVFVATCALEVLQLWQPPFLQALRSTLPGRLILGNTFSWSDFPAYVIGCFVGYGWAMLLRRVVS